MLNTATGGEKHRFRSDSSSGDREQGKFLWGFDFTTRRFTDRLTNGLSDRFTDLSFAQILTDLRQIY